MGSGIKICTIVASGALLVGATFGFPACLIAAPISDVFLIVVDSKSSARIDAAIAAQLQKKRLTELPLADDLRVLRRLSLALTGTIPALAEIREFERISADARFELWTDRLLEDPRFNDYFAERLARSFVPDLPAEPFFIYRRRRFVVWLTEQLAARRPFDALVAEMISSEGVWTDRPATNFVTGHNLDAVRLANRTTRAFLGLRLDCAQCHDHPFAKWKQDDFHHLAAFFSEPKLGLFGVRDNPKEYLAEDAKSPTKKPYSPKVPFRPDWLPDEGNRRQRLARWVTHPENDHFAKAVAARVWALVFGQALNDPVDDLEQPSRVSDAVEHLARAFRSSDCDLRMTIKVAVSTSAFRRVGVDHPSATEQHEKSFAAFPMSRLRSDQLAQSIVQCSSLRPYTPDSAFVSRTFAFFGVNDFMALFGDAGEEELSPRGGNMSQQLILMNGKLVRERVNDNLFSAAGRISRLASTDSKCIECAYLVCLTRRPKQEETAHFTDQIRGLLGDERARAVEDMMWSLVNSSEFAWNH